MTIGDHIRKRRLALGFLQKDVVAQIGVTEASMCNWETNRTIPEIRIVPKIIRFLGYVPYKPCATLEERLAMVRQAQGFSMKALARKTDIDEGTWRNWERGGCRKQSIVENLMKFICTFGAIQPEIHFSSER